MNWKKLSSISNADPLFRGCLFRFRRLVPEDEIVEYMLFQTWEASGLGLVRDCGYEAGLVLIVLPAEAMAEGAVGISPQWLIHHWKKWIDNSSSPDEVWVLKDGRSTPDALPDEEFNS
ncbi:Imm45 family immunity protein [Pseudomonas sp. CGJS7]|uniref:Imm45 family immunity protein n=1 Tax=Pseudomonas sp. CGJS7 TaxID=3109348 RepID=UPI00300911E7